MYEDLLNAVSNLVHRHVLRELHDMTGAMLARLDQAPAIAPPPPAAPRRQAKVSTVERRLRKERAEQRKAKATNGPAEPGELPDSEPLSGWPVLRQQVRARLTDLELSHTQAAAAIGDVKRGTLSTWLSRDFPEPGAGAQSRIREWLRELPAVAPDAAPVDPPPVYTLDPAERDRLTGHLSLGDDRALRQQFGATVELLQKASRGEHLNADVIAKLRGVLANGAVAE